MKNLIILLCTAILLSSCGKEKVEKSTYLVFIGVGPWSSYEPTPVFKITATGQPTKTNITNTLYSTTYEFERGKAIDVVATLTQGKTTLNMKIYAGTEALPDKLIFDSYGAEVSARLNIQ
jgi:major membrane immunogen (membrane-anchored lipoprotein)